MIIERHAWPNRHSHNSNKMLPVSQMGLIDAYSTKQLVTKPVLPEAHAQCYKWSQLLHTYYLKNVGQENLTMPSWLICSLPTPSHQFMAKDRGKWGFPGSSSGKNLPANAGRHKRLGLDPWVRKIPWRKTWQSTPVFLPGEYCGQRNLVGYSP